MKNKKDQYRKIYAKISHSLPKGLIGLTSLGEMRSFETSYELGQTMAKLKKVLLIDLDNEAGNDKEFANIKELLRSEGDFKKDGKLYRLNFTKSDDVEALLENEAFINLIMKAKEDFDYIIINEKPLSSSQAYLTKDIEDGKILLVEEDKIIKRDFNLAVKEIKSLGFNLLGVIYYK